MIIILGKLMGTLMLIVNIIKQVIIMMYLLAIFFPPLAVLICGKPIQALINFFLCFLIWIPAVIHAILIVRDHKADKRMERQIKLLKK